MQQDFMIVSDSTRISADRRRGQMGIRDSQYMLLVIHSGEPLKHSLLSYMHHPPCPDSCIARPFLHEVQQSCFSATGQEGQKTNGWGSGIDHKRER